MKDLPSKCLISAILADDTESACSLLNSHPLLFNDPIKGSTLQAEALYCAIKRGNNPIIKSILNFNLSCDVAFFNFCGETPLGLALRGGLTDILPFLLLRTDKNFALYVASKFHHQELLQYLRANCVFKARLLLSLGLPLAA